MVLNEKYSISHSQIETFRNKGWIKLDKLLDAESVDFFRKEIADAVRRESKDVISLEKRDTYGKAFLQVFNLWRKSKIIENFTKAKRFAGIAADLLGVENVRIYHDQALYKEAGGGRTPWHQDQYYWPIDTAKTVTMWMPLVDLTEDMGILQFVDQSHKIEDFHDLQISDESDQYFENYIIEHLLNKSNITISNAGDASFHYGWTLHYAPENRSDKLREVMTIIYVADGASVITPKHEIQSNDLKTWMPGLKPGDFVNSPLNPIVL